MASAVGIKQTEEQGTWKKWKLCWKFCKHRWLFEAVPSHLQLHKQTKSCIIRFWPQQYKNTKMLQFCSCNGIYPWGFMLVRLCQLTATPAGLGNTSTDPACPMPITGNHRQPLHHHTCEDTTPGNNTHKKLPTIKYVGEWQ